MKIIGVDTGISGYISLYDSISQTVTCHQFPYYWSTLAGKTRNGKLKRRRKINYTDLVELLHSFKKHGVKEIYIEKVHALPRDGASAAFTFGEVYGATVAASVALNYEVCLVSPQAWKKHFNLIGTEKTASVNLAADIFGQEQFKFKKDHNKADSALIACYGAQVT